MAADSERKRVHFRSPEDLVEQADALAEIEGKDRTDVILEALENYIEAETESERFRQRIAEAYYDDRIEYDIVEALVGTEQARTFQLLKADLESDPLELADPDADVDVYDGETATVEPAD
jgi:metal-responsive CopG/Arc/MetJ family transcriptional regulator